MNNLLKIVLGVALVGSAPAWAGGGGAYDAIEAARRGYPGSRLVQVTAQRGDPQPQEWTIVFSDSSARGGIREVAVADGVIVSQRTPLRGYSETTTQPSINMSRMNLDSGGAFEIAEKQAQKQRIGFDWVDYKLSSSGLDGAPVWQLTLFDRMGARAGVVEISALDGTLVSPLRTASQPRADETTQGFSESGTGRKMGGVIGTVGGILGGTAVKVRDVTLRTAGTVEEVLTGERTIGPKDDE